MAHDGRAIANFVLDQCAGAGVEVSPLALQKIVYFCHVWCLIELGKPLVRHQFEAWEHGPVLQYLYREFKRFGAAPINARAQCSNPQTGRAEAVPYELDQATRDLLTRVVAIYSRMTPSALRELSHAEYGPWHRVWYHGGKINPGMRIDDRDIVRFYSSAPRSATLQ